MPHCLLVKLGTPKFASLLRTKSWLLWCLWGVAAAATAASIAHQEQVAARQRAERNARHAQMLAQEVWDLDEESAARSLQVLAEAERLDRVTITLSDGTPFAEVVSSAPDRLETRRVTRLGKEDTPIVYDGQRLATLSVHGERRDLGSYVVQVLSVLLLGVMLHLGAWVLRHRRELEQLRLRSEIALREEVEARLRQREGELRRAQRLEALGKIAGGVAHDFNNLLTVITGFAELAQSSRTPEKTQAHLAALLEATERARTLTAQLLAFGRQQAAKSRAVDVNSAVLGMREMLRRLLPDDVSLDTQLAPDLAPALIDPGQLEQVIMNLVLNARDAMPNGGTIRLTTAQRQGPNGPRITLAVEDQGVGMDEELKAMIFEPFFSTKGPGKGTGLGLAMVQSILQQSGADIELRSAPGQGSTFTVVFHEATEVAPQASRDADASEPRAARSRRLLVVEDDPAVRGLVRELLESNGFDVTTARDPEDALLILQRATPRVNAVLSDVVMPMMTGPELEKRARAAGVDVPFVFMSGHVPGEVEFDTSNLLRKPFTRAELSLALDRVLDPRAAELRA